MNAFVFPGQGSQKVGMGQSLCERFPAGKTWFARANAVLGYDLMRLCFEGPEEQLTDTLHAQPALLTVSTLYFQWALARGHKSQMAAGHSVGEYAALVAAGVLGFEDALRLVQRRAELMASAPPGTMAAIIGLADDRLEETLQAAAAAGVVVAANHNSPGQVVISGAANAVEAAMAEAKSRGAKITKKLAVSGAFHSPLMNEAGAQMAELIAAAPFQEAEIPVYQNTTARPATAAAALKAALQAQMTGPVRWTETIRAMVADGTTHFYELGPGTVLSGLIKRIDKEVTVESAEIWE
ncbi:MAG TPA: ACP S-malonyltransferase [Abditibacteriaceae bacterium]|nr:ACP S-malonyltransferase [Abditibacteriaceae bacterium]